MPIYEFLCEECNIIYNFFSKRVNTEKIPDCPRCSVALQKQMSVFRSIGNAKDSSDEIGDVDEAKLGQALDELAGEAEGINEEDPKQMARLMRKFSKKSGLDLGDGLEEALCRLEAGDDPEKIEQEMGDVLENEDPLALSSKRLLKGREKRVPIKDETLYTL